MSDERARIQAEYERRLAEMLPGRYAPDAVSTIALVRSREIALLDLLKGHRINLDDSRVLDLGCGGGGELQRLLALGSDPRRLTGIDLLPFRLDGAREAVPGVAFLAADGGAMPFRDSSFDLAMLFTVLSSILDPGLRHEVAEEVRRVLRPGGALLWYDFKWNPTNRQTTGIGPRHIRELFPTFNHETRSVTLAPPIARAVAPRSMRLSELLERVPFLRSHTIGIAVKPGGVSW